MFSDVLRDRRFDRDKKTADLFLISLTIRKVESARRTHGGMRSREDSGGGGGSSRGVSGDYYRLTQAIKYILIRAHSREIRLA